MIKDPIGQLPETFSNQESLPNPANSFIAHIEGRYMAWLESQGKASNSLLPISPEELGQFKKDLLGDEYECAGLIAAARNYLYNETVIAAPSRELIAIERVDCNNGPDQVFPTLNTAGLKTIRMMSSYRGKHKDRVGVITESISAYTEALNATLDSSEKVALGQLDLDSPNQDVLGEVFDLFVYRQMYKSLNIDTNKLLLEFWQRSTGIMRSQRNSPFFNTAMLAFGVIAGGFSASFAKDFSIGMDPAAFAATVGIWLNLNSGNIAAGITQAVDQEKQVVSGEIPLSSEERELLEYIQKFRSVGDQLEVDDYQFLMTSYTDSKLEEYESKLSKKSPVSVSKQLEGLLRIQQQRAMLSMSVLDGLSPNTVSGATYLIDAITVTIATGVVNYVASQHSITDFIAHTGVYIAGFAGVEAFLRNVNDRRKRASIIK